MGWEAYLAVGAVVMAAGTAVYVARSGPIVARQVLGQLVARVEAVESRYERAAVDWRAHREGLEGLLDEMATQADRAERERRRVAARDSREAKKENGAIDGGDLDELTRRARSMGHPV